VSDPLAVKGVEVRYGGVAALAGATFALRPGQAVGLIGPNGSGKSTLVDVLSGFRAPDAGSVHLHGRDVTRWGAGRRTRAGLARTFQRVAAFSGLTVAEHRAVAVGSVARPHREAARRAEGLLRAVRIDAAAPTPADALPAAERRLLDVARALWTEPGVLVLDEPFAGLDEAQAAALVACLQGCRDAGIALVLVEHRLAELFGVIDRLLVLDGGRLIADGPPREVIARDEVVRSYQGVAALAPR
jgi:branched-chain amino acid transport system ATP-binding protein